MNGRFIDFANFICIVEHTAQRCGGGGGSSSCSGDGDGSTLPVKFGEETRKRRREERKREHQRYLFASFDTFYYFHRYTACGVLPSNGNVQNVHISFSSLSLSFCLCSKWRTVNYKEEEKELLEH